MIHNYYLYEDDGVLSMIPWDYNLAFGGFMSSDSATNLVNYPIDTPVSGGNVESRPMLAWIFDSEEYTELYHEYFAEFIESYFDSGVFEDEITRVYEMIAPYVEKDPTKFCTYEEFETGVDTLKEFCVLRAQSISGQLDGSIPSTSDGQNADSSALIDATGITISDMGSMNMGNMNNMDMNIPGMNNNMDIEMPDMNGGTGVEMPDMDGGTGVEMPDMNGGTDIGMPDMNGGTDVEMPDMNGGTDVGMPNMNNIDGGTSDMNPNSTPHGGDNMDRNNETSESIEEIQE